MNYYVRLFFNSKFLLSSLILSVVLFYSLPLNADVYDVNITNGSVDVVPFGLNSPYDLFNQAFDGYYIDNTNYQMGDDSPMDYTGLDGGSGYGSAESDFNSTSSFSVPTTGNNQLAPTLSGRNPLGLSNARYFNLGLGYWTFRTAFSQKLYSNTPLSTNYSTSTENYRLGLSDKVIIPNPSYRTSFFNYSNFKNDLITALIGSDNFNFLVRFVSALNTSPVGSNFSYTLPSVFGFDTGFVISIPFNDILHGTGDWYSFSNVINLFRSLLSVVYYCTVAVIIIRCIFIYN